MKVDMIAALIESQVNIWVPVLLDEVKNPKKLAELAKISPVLAGAGSALFNVSKAIDAAVAAARPKPSPKKKLARKR